MEDKPRKNANPYRHMNLDELREVITTSYKGMSIKELGAVNPQLKQALEAGGFAPLFHDEGLLARTRRNNNYFDNLTPKEAMLEVETRYDGLTLSEFIGRDGSLAAYLREHHIIEGENLLETLVRRKILVRGSKSHSCPKHKNACRTKTRGFRSPKDYMTHYLQRHHRYAT
ncbi:MAG: hypothetical protein AABX07_04920 [Nanoarchaeota archaeon]